MAPLGGGRTPQHCHLRQAIGERSPIVLRFRETLSVSNDAYGTEFQALTGMYACTASPFVVGSRPGRPAPGRRCRTPSMTEKKNHQFFRRVNGSIAGLAHASAPISYLSPSLTSPLSNIIGSGGRVPSCFVM